MLRKRICVIGAGPFGLIATKCALEEGLEPLVYERTAHIGGLWRYHEDDVDGLASVMKMTIINSSKEMSALSDFPPDDHLPNFMHHRQVYGYIESYAKKFGLEKHVQFNTDVLKVDMAEDYEETGRLTVTVQNKKTGTTSRRTFDGVMVCVGHHVYPNVPRFPGQESFKGEVFHTHSLKRVERFDDQDVVIVGVGNSGMDAACEISSVAKQVYLSTRKGTWVLPRVGAWGVPFDVLVTRRWLDVLFKTSPYCLTCSVSEFMLNHHGFDHAKYGMKPRHRIWSQHPSVSDNLPIKLLSGTVLVRSNISRFVEDGVVFEGEDEVTKCDSVVLATGYLIKFPFLDEKLGINTNNNQVHLYKYVFPPHLKHPSLSFVGLIQSLGAGFPIAEAQARWISLVYRGELALPPAEAMEVDVRKKMERNSRRFAKSPRHTVQVDYIPYLDEINSLFGTKPSMARMLFTDPRLFGKLFFGPSLPYQYRLKGPNPWPGAREAVLDWKKRVARPLKGGREVKA